MKLKIRVKDIEIEISCMFARVNDKGLRELIRNLLIMQEKKHGNDKQRFKKY